METFDQPHHSQLDLDGQDGRCKHQCAILEGFRAVRLIPATLSLLVQPAFTQSLFATLEQTIAPDTQVIKAVCTITSKLANFA